MGQVDGFCDEKFKDVERLFANQRLAQLCVFVDGKMVVSILNLKFYLRHFLQVNLWQNGGEESYGENTLSPIFSRSPFNVNV